MPIQNYPRFLTKSSKTAQQIQSGLPIVGSDGVSGDFNTLKVNADGSINVAGGGGGGTATSTNQVVQISEAQTTNTNLQTLITNLNGLYNSFNLLLQELAFDLAPSSNTDTIISNQLEGQDQRGNWFNVGKMVVPIWKKAMLDTNFTVNFNGNGIGTSWDLNKYGLYPYKIVFHENNIVITALYDRNNVDVLSNYFVYNTTLPIANNGQEILSKLEEIGQYFSFITTNGNCHFTAYYLYEPYME